MFVVLLKLVLILCLYLCLPIIEQLNICVAISMKAKPCVISPILATRSFDACPLSTRHGSKPGKAADVAKIRLSPPGRVRRPWKGISTRIPTRVQKQHVAEGIVNPGHCV